jgi:hypothetical protein
MVLRFKHTAKRPRDHFYEFQDTPSGTIKVPVELTTEGREAKRTRVAPTHVHGIQQQKKSSRIRSPLQDTSLNMYDDVDALEHTVERQKTKVSLTGIVLVNKI